MKEEKLRKQEVKEEEKKTSDNSRNIDEKGETGKSTKRKERR